MRRIVKTGGLGGLLLLASLASAQETNDSRRMLSDVLDRVRQRAHEQQVADRQRALQVLQQAQQARAEGRIADAVKLAERAQVLFPESAAVRQALQELRGDQADSRDQRVNLATAKNRLEEAVDYAQQLLRDRNVAQARELAEAVREAAARLPQGIDLTRIIQEAQKVLDDRPAAEAAPGNEILPAPQPAPPQPPKSTSATRQMLMKKLDTEWRDAPLLQVLQDLAKETGVPINIDLDLQRAHVFDTRRVYLQAHGAPAERILRTVTDISLSAYLLVDGEVQIMPKHKALDYAVTRSRQSPEVTLRSVEVRPLRRAPYPALPLPEEMEKPPTVEPPPAHRATTLRPGEIEKLPSPGAVQQPEYLRSGPALRAEIDRLVGPPKSKEEEP
jgi:tetratricopeptide (TPR) repeat protein